MGEPIPEYKKRAAAKRAEQYESIPAEWRLPESHPTPRNTYEFLKTGNVLTNEEIEITETTDAQALLKKLAVGELSAVTVTKAFSKRAAIAQQLIRCCTEMFFSEALQTAEYLDDYLKKNGKTIGPLHGLPVSIKDNFDVQGHDSTVGWVSLIGKPAKKDSYIARILRQQGAVLYCKTNIPQSLMMSDSFNHVFKQSVNAYNNELISGGSSGGEGALVGCRGSIVGVGTDIGGSVRVPANLQGLYGLSPSTGRVPMDKSGKRMYIVPPVAGPLCHDLSTLEAFMDGILAAEPWKFDPTAIPVPWRHEIAAKPTKPIKIGYYLDDGYVRVQPPIEEAVQTAVQALKAAGHEVLPWDVSSHEEGRRLWLKGVLANGGKKFRAEAEKGGEPAVQGMLTGELEDVLDVDEGEEVHEQIRVYKETYLQRWLDAGIDALIMPVQPYCSYKPRTWVRSNNHVGYTAQFNLLDWAALAVPMGVARPNEIDLDKDPGDGRGSWNKHEPRNKSDKFNWEQYDPKLVAGMPVNIQIVGGKHGEEKAVSVAKALEEALKQH